MQAVNSIQQAFDDVPSPPASYSDYVQRKLQESTQEAYARGFESGCRYELLVLFIGLVAGGALGFYVALIN
jgi:hypothetical protein